MYINKKVLYDKPYIKKDIFAYHMEEVDYCHNEQTLYKILSALEQDNCTLEAIKQIVDVPLDKVKSADIPVIIDNNITQYTYPEKILKELDIEDEEYFIYCDNLLEIIDVYKTESRRSTIFNECLNEVFEKYVKDNSICLKDEFEMIIKKILKYYNMIYCELKVE